MTREQILRSLQNQLNYLSFLLAKLKKQMNNREQFYQVALSYLGTDVTPNDIVPDEYACAEVINTLHQKAFGFQIGGGASTYLLYNALLSSPFFTKVDVSARGDICISPTGHGNGRLSNGHVGIVGEKGVIMSNDSADGKFKENYNLDTWRKRYVDIGGYPVDFFRRV